MYFVTNTIYFFFFGKNASEIRIPKIAYYSNRVVVHFLESFAKHIFVTLSIAQLWGNNFGKFCQELPRLSLLAQRRYLIAQVWTSLLLYCIQTNGAKVFLMTTFWLFLPKIFQNCCPKAKLWTVSQKCVRKFLENERQLDQSSMQFLICGFHWHFFQKRKKQIVLVTKEIHIAFVYFTS